MTAPLDTPEAMFTAIVQRRLDGVLDCFSRAEDTYVFLEGPRWSNRGGERIAEGWRKYFEAPIRILGFRWVEGPYTFESPELAQVAGIVDLDVTGDGSSRRLRMRMTWLLRREDGRWRIVHEHGSQPLADPYGAGDWWPEGATEPG